MNRGGTVARWADLGVTRERGDEPEADAAKATQQESYPRARG